MEDIYFASGSLENFVDQVIKLDRPAHFVVVGTKPDLIKQAPILQELLKQGENAFLIHTGQHYDENLSGGIEKEFGLKVDVNLKVSGGSLHANVSKIILRFGSVLEAIKTKSPNQIILPYTHGDTTTCFASATASFSNGIPVAHVEAGIRTYMIEKAVLEAETQKPFNIQNWFEVSANIQNYNKGSHEPFPEQWNTRATEAGTGIFFASEPLAQQNLQNEGFPKDLIKVVGNTVVDAANFAGKIKSNIFETYPALESGFIRVCIHRRENTENPERFMKMFKMIELLVEESSYPVLWILLPATKSAIKNNNLEARLEKLRSHENIIISDIWPKYSDVIAAMKHCVLCATDSGSMQEEMNLLQIPCATLRYGSDRPETLFAKSNILCPFVSAELMKQIILESASRKDLFEFPNIYGENVSEKIVKASKNYLEQTQNQRRLNPS